MLSLRVLGSRSWFQFRLRTLLAMMAVLAVPLAWKANEVRNRRAAVAEVKRFEGLRQSLLTYRHVEEALDLRKPIEPPGPRWITRILGEDFFDVPISVLLQNTSADDSTLARLACLTKLERLQLMGTDVTDAGLVHLKGMKALFLLELEGTRVSGPGLSHLAGFDHLRSLSLVRTAITDAGLENLIGWTHLQYLSLDGTAISDAGLVHLAKLPELQRLSVQGTKVSDNSIVHLREMQQLKVLWLPKETFSDEGLTTIRSALPNCSVQVGRWFGGPPRK